MQQKIIILDFGSQTTQLIGRRVRELDTFCEILPYNKFPVADDSVIGVILSGSPYSVHDPEAFKVDLSQFIGRLPVLGICYGAQFISHTLGGKVEKADSREYGRANLQTVDTTRESEDHAVAAQLLLQFCNRRVDERGGTPLLAGAADVDHEIPQQLHALKRVVHLGVELDGPDGFTI